MQLLRHCANGYAPRSLANRWRNRRFKLFESLAATLPRPLRIIDVGGTTAFWELRGWANRSDVRIVTVNHVEQPQTADNVVPVVGDATDLHQYPDGAFDIAFSNSVIEHLFDYESQQAMAREMMRVGNSLWLQTPNYWFPMEPHFLVPGWQWLPRQLRVAIIQRFRCGWRGPAPTRTDAEALVDEVRLLTRAELQQFFPGAIVAPERFGGLTKSWIVYSGFTARAEAPLRLAA